MSQKPHSANCRREVALNNEGGAPTELLVLPAGRIEGRDGRWWDNSAPDDVIADFQAQGIDLAIDYEHASELAPITGQPSPAAGWIKALENRGGEIWARVEWTPRATEMIESREYRYISPTFFFDDSRTVLALSSIALTNQPNLRQAALNKRGDGDTDPEPQEPTMKPEARKALCRSLGLAEEASDGAIAAAVEALQTDRDKALNSAKTPPLDQFVPRADHDQVKGELDKATNRLAEIADTEITAVVDAAVKAGKIAPSSKGYHVAACRAEGGLQAFKSMVGDLDASDVTKPSELDGKSPPDAGGSLSKEEKAMCRYLGVTEEQFIKERQANKAA
ncbi:MAG: phage protease [Pseudomonadota bacterium]